MKYDRFKDAHLTRGVAGHKHKKRTEMMKMVRDPDGDYNAINALQDIINMSNTKIRQRIPGRKGEFYRKVVEHVLNEFDPNKWDFVHSVDKEADMKGVPKRDPKTGKLKLHKVKVAHSSKRITFPANPNVDVDATSDFY